MKPSIKLILIIWFFISCTAKDGKLPFSPIWYQDIGVLLESVGMAVHPTDMITINFLVVFPTFDKFINLSSVCNKSLSSLYSEIARKQYSFIESTMHMFSGSNSKILEENCQILPPGFCDDHYNHRDINNTQKAFKRKKRFLPLIALGLGTAGLGLSIYNTVTNTQAEEAINSLIRNQEKIKNHVNNLVVNQNKIIQLEEGVYLRIEELKGEISAKLTDLGCELEKEIYQLSIREQVDAQLLKYEGIIHSIFKGQLTDDILKPNIIYELIKDHPRLSDSLYMQDISLFYRLSKIIPFQFSVSTMGLSTTLLIPYVTSFDVAPLYLSHNLGYPGSSNTFIRPKIPSFISLFNNKGTLIPLPIDRANCEVSNGIWICSDLTTIIEKEDHCLRSLLLIHDVGNLTCDHEVRSFPQNSVIVYSSGILVFGYKDYIINDNFRNHIPLSQTIRLNSTRWNFIPFSSFKSITIGGKIYLAPNRYSLTNSVDQEFLRYDGLDIGNLEDLELHSWIDNSKLREEISRLKSHQLTSLQLEHIQELKTHLWMLYLILVGLSLVIVWNLYLTYQRIKTKKDDTKVVFLKKDDSLLLPIHT